MLDFVTEGQWLAFVPVPVVAEYLVIGLMIFALCRNLIGHKQGRYAHDRPNGVSAVAIVPAVPGFRGAHGIDLMRPKTLQTMARHLFPPEAIRSSFSLA